MALAVGVSASIGLALGLRFNVFILIPTIILAVVSTGVVHATRGDQALSVVVTIVLVATTLQICYLVGSVTRVAFERNVPLERSKDLAINILGHMEVVGSDGEHMGTVDHIESADRIVLTSADPKAGGKPHLISAEWVDHIDNKVHLNKPSRKALQEWQIAA